jgi:hypothetical protein
MRQASTRPMDEGQRSESVEMPKLFMCICMQDVVIRRKQKNRQVVDRQGPKPGDVALFLSRHRTPMAAPCVKHDMLHGRREFFSTSHAFQCCANAPIRPSLSHRAGAEPVGVSWS